MLESPGFIPSTYCGVMEMAQLIKALIATSENLTSTLGSHMMKERTNSLQIIF